MDAMSILSSHQLFGHCTICFWNFIIVERYQDALLTVHCHFGPSWDSNRCTCSSFRQAKGWVHRLQCRSKLFRRMVFVPKRNQDASRHQYLWGYLQRNPELRLCQPPQTIRSLLYVRCHHSIRYFPKLIFIPVATSKSALAGKTP